jgi:hypothetical protein
MIPSSLIRLGVCGLAPALLGGVAVAQQPEPAAVRGTATSLRSCINTTFVTNWTPYDDHTILVQSGNRSFKVITNRCGGLTSPLPQINTVVKGGSSICSPADVDLYVSSGGMTTIPCFVQSIQPLSKEEAQAMQEAGRHKR